MSHQIADKLRRAIVSGWLQPGEQLPSTGELRKHFGIAAMTARDALLRLKSEGYASSEKGRGFFVTGPTESAGEMPSYAQALRAQMVVIAEASDAPLCHVSASGHRIVVGDDPTRTRAVAELEWADETLTVEIYAERYTWQPGDDDAARQILADWSAACARPRAERSA